MSLLIVLFAALMIPLLMARFKVTTVPTAIVEIVVGILLGQTGLQVIKVTEDLSYLSSLGVILLIFLSGMEIDFDLFNRKKQAHTEQTIQPVKLATVGFGTVLLASTVLAYLVKVTGLFTNIPLAIILFSTVALGVVIAALKEKELLSQPIGQTILLTAVFGEVFPLIALSVYASLNGGHAGRIWLILLIFLAAIFLLFRFRVIYQFFDRINKTTTQLDIRLAFFLVFALVTVAESVGAENILGAFLAGIVMKLLRPNESTQEKLTSIGYGFFIPIFFIMTGVKLDLRSLLTNPQILVLIPLLFASFLLAKSLLFFVFRRAFPTKNALAGSFLSATTITLVLPTLEVAKQLNQITEQQAGAFTLAAVLSCIVSPILFNKLYQPDEKELRKTRVHFVGTNMLTIPVAQQLSKGWYDIHMFTDLPDNYRTYNSEVHDVQLLPDLTKQTLEENHVFDTDILVIGYHDHSLNFEIAQLAMQHTIRRVIVRFESHDITNERYDILKEQGIELFNTFDVNITLLREMIESPSTLKMLKDTQSGLFEVTVLNRRYTGIPLQQMPLIDEITISQIYRKGTFISPRGDTIIEQGDHLIFTGNKQSVKELRNKLNIPN
ncbi:MAG: cation:proton antiporter [Enterococcus sp.]